MTPFEPLPEPRSPRALALFAVLVLALSCVRPDEPANTEAPPIPLPFHQTLTLGLAPGQVQRFTLDLAPGRAARIELDQSHLDLAVRVLDATGRPLFTFDTETATYAPERFCIASPEGEGAAPGTLYLEISAFRGSGPYTLATRALPSTTPDAPGTLCARATLAFVAARDRARYTPEQRADELRQAAELWQRAGEPGLAALAWRDLGALWGTLDRGEQALAAFERGVATLAEVDEPFLEISLLNRLGLAWLDHGALHESVPMARDTLERALARARASGQLQGEASALLNLGRVDSRAGDPHRAIARYRQALPLWQRLGSLGDQAQTHLNLADAYGLLDLHREAFDAVDSGLALARRAGDRRREADLLSARAWLHYLSGHAPEGIPWLRRSLDLRRALGDRDGVSSTLNRLGTLFESAGDFAAAESLIHDSLDRALADGSPLDIAANRASMGCLEQKMGRTQAARHQLELARRALAQSDDPKARSHIEYCLAQVARAEDDLAAALAHIDEALDTVDRLRAIARPQGYQYRPIWLWQDYSQLRAELLVALHRDTGRPEYLDAAFAASDLDRARNLFELVVESRLAPPAATAEQRQRERRIQRQLDRLALLRIAAVDSRGEAPPVRSSSGHSLDQDVARQIRALTLELEQVRAEIRAKGSRRVEDLDQGTAPLESPSPLPVAELTRLLDDETLLLAYDLGESTSFLFTLDSTGPRVFDLAPRATLEAAAEAFYHALMGSADVADQWQLTGHHLAEMLLPEGVLRPGVRRLLVVAEGLLHYIPFTTLPMADPLADSPATDDPPLLLDRYSVVNLPSAAVFAALRARSEARSFEPGTLAVFADPVYSADEERSDDVADAPLLGTTRDIAARRLPDGELPRLPWTTHEARAILELFDPASTLARLGHQASKRAVTQTDLTPYRLLHFASHARIDEELPELSSLILSTVDTSGQRIDGELRLHEIYRLRLDADLTVLSGCQTALGRRVRGDGLMGLTRGFFYAGSARLVVSLWPVEDRATAHLMPRVYRALREDGARPAQALRQAQQWMRGHDQWRAPYYWAPFVLQGDF